MANKLNTQQDWERHDFARMELATKEIAASDNLRFFLRSQLAACGHGFTPSGADALDTARLLGRHEIGSELVQTILTHNPDLYPKLIKEQQDEQRDRASNAERADDFDD